MNSFWRFLSLGGALVLMVVAGVWVANVYLFPAPKSRAADPEQPSFSVQEPVVQPAPTIAAPTIPVEGSIQKSVETCREERRAMRSASQRTTTEKAYVAQCRAAATATLPPVIASPTSPSEPPVNSPAPAASTPGAGLPAPKR